LLWRGPLFSPRSVFYQTLIRGLQPLRFPLRQDIPSFFETASLKALSSRAPPSILLDIVSDGSSLRVQACRRLWRGRRLYSNHSPVLLGFFRGPLRAPCPRIESDFFSEGNDDFFRSPSLTLSFSMALRFSSQSEGDHHTAAL